MSRVGVSGVLVIVGLTLAACTIQPLVVLPGATLSQSTPDVSLPIVSPAPNAASPAETLLCPPKVAYTAEQNAALDAWIGANPTSPILPFLIDYHNMRVADDACLKAASPPATKP